MSETRCSFCDQAGEHVCPTCGRVYCDLHGAETCTSCLSPDAASPSGRFYLGSVLTLLAATAVGIFLVVSPPGEETRADAPQEATPPAVGEPTATPTPTPDPNATPTPEPTAGNPTPATEPTAAATPGDGESPGGPGTRTYSVVSGDTLSGIAAQFGLTLDELLALNPQVNEDEPLQIGQELVVPDE